MIARVIGVATPTALTLLTFVTLFGSGIAASGQDSRSAPTAAASAQTSASISGGPGMAYSIKPSEVVVPEGVPVGEYRRIIEPHANWTLICDENLKEKKRVCNISQQVVDPAGNIAFSWSLAGTGDGQPVMILRTPASAGKGTAIKLSFPDKTKPISAITDACDTKVCVAMLPVGPRMKGYISKRSAVEVSFAAAAAANGRIVFQTTFDGLPQALAAI